MKFVVSMLMFLMILSSCSTDTQRHKNPYLPNYSFSRVIDTKMPLYSGLSSPMNPRLINDDGQSGNIIAMKISDSDFRAYDATCPNQYPTSCSKMTISGLNAKCPCDNVSYSLFNGLPVNNDAEYPMKSYRIDIMGNGKIRIYN